MTEAISASRRRLAAALKGLRTDAHLSAQALGDELGWSQSKVSKIENGRTVPSVEDVRRWLHRFSVTGDAAQDLIDVATEVSTQAVAWRDVNRGGPAARQRSRNVAEAETTGMAIYQSEVVPGLLQTPEYARTLLEIHSLVDPHDIPAMVLSRLDRQPILFDESRPFDVVITETALRWRPGNRAVALGQLDRISVLAKLPNVSIGVITRERQETANPLHSFVLLRYPDHAQVQVETLTSELELSDPRDLAIYEDFFRAQKQQAVYDTQLIGVLDRIAQELLDSETM